MTDRSATRPGGTSSVAASAAVRAEAAFDTGPTRPSALTARTA